MGLVGFLLQLATIGFVGYLGYTVELNYMLLLISPFGLIFGQLMRTSTGSSRRRERGFNALKAFVSGYLVGLVLLAVVFGLGYGLMHILDLRPAEGVGRY